MHQYRTIMLTFPNMPIYTLKVLTVVQLRLNDDLKYKTGFAIPIVLSLNLKFLNTFIVHLRILRPCRPSLSELCYRVCVFNCLPECSTD